MSNTQLTDDQKHLVEKICDQWVAIALSCEPVDFEVAKHWASECYRTSGMAVPEVWIYAASPFAGQKIAIDMGLETNWAFAGLDAPWLAMYDLYNQLGNDIGIMRVRLELAKTCGWIGFYDKLCILQDRPRFIRQNERKQLHCLTAPAIEYSDRSGLYSIEGVVVPKKVVMNPAGQTIDEIVNEDNEEIKRIRIEQFGHDRFFAEVGATEIDRRENVIENNTREQLLRCSGDLLFLRTFCPSTGRIYALQILDNNADTCEKAQAWLWNLDSKDMGTTIVGRT